LHIYTLNGARRVIRAVYRAAKLLINPHGDEAAVFVAGRRTSCSGKATLRGAAVWRAIVRAAEEPQRNRPEGEAVN
jgi:hypothetical protein